MNRKDAIGKILKERFGITEVIKEDTNLIGEFGFESISLVELATALTKETGVMIAASQAAKWETVQSILDTISSNEEAAAVN